MTEQLEKLKCDLLISENELKNLFAYLMMVNDKLFIKNTQHRELMNKYKTLCNKEYSQQGIKQLEEYVNKT